MKQCGYRRLADPTEAERGDGDAKLTASQISFDIAQHPLDQPSAEAILVGQRGDLEASRFDKRELRRDKKRIRGQQENSNQQVDDGGRHADNFSSRNARTSAASTSRATKLAPMPRTRMNVSAPR